MLASKKQDWAVSREYALETQVRRQPRKYVCLDVELRKKCCAFVVLLLLLAGIATLQSERIVSNGYQYVQLQNELRDVEQKNEKLRVEIARLKSLERIQTIAKNDLGMNTPKQIYAASSAVRGSGKLASAVEKESPRRKL